MNRTENWYTRVAHTHTHTYPDKTLTESTVNALARKKILKFIYMLFFPFCVCAE